MLRSASLVVTHVNCSLLSLCRRARTIRNDRKRAPSIFGSGVQLHLGPSTCTIHSRLRTRQMRDSRGPSKRARNFIKGQWASCIGRPHLIEWLCLLRLSISDVWTLWPANRRSSYDLFQSWPAQDPRTWTRM